MVIEHRETSTPTALKSLARRHFEELWGEGNLAAAAELYDPECIGHCGIFLDQRDYPESEQAILARDRGGFPDATVSIEDQLSEGDRVLTRWTMRARHTIPLYGRPATGGEIVLHGMHVHRIRNGRIVEVWACSRHARSIHAAGFGSGPCRPEPAGVQ